MRGLEEDIVGLAGRHARQRHAHAGAVIRGRIQLEPHRLARGVGNAGDLPILRRGEVEREQLLSLRQQREAAADLLRLLVQREQGRRRHVQTHGRLIEPGRERKLRLRRVERDDRPHARSARLRFQHAGGQGIGQHAVVDPQQPLGSD